MEQLKKTQKSISLGKLKGRAVAYWIITVLISLVFLNGGINDIFKQQPYFGLLIKMGYPGFVSIILGIWKTLGAIVLLLPGIKLIKEWAYAGFFFLLTGAIVSHLQIGDNIIFQTLLLILIVLSWHLRPTNRRLQFTMVKR
jgi:hypothetical protein